MSINIVIDTNIFISALIKDSLTRKIIVNSGDNLLFPEFGFEEVYEHKKEILKKSGLSEKDLDTLLLRLIKYLRIIPKHLIIPFREKAQNIMKEIDPDDSVFIATALCFGASIWSEDKHFQQQKVIPVISTREMIRNL